MGRRITAYRQVSRQPYVSVEGLTSGPERTYAVSRWKGNASHNVVMFQKNPTVHNTFGTFLQFADSGMRSERLARKGISPGSYTVTFGGSHNPNQLRNYGKTYMLNQATVHGALIGSAAIVAGGYMVHRHRANARAMKRGHGVPPKSGSKPLSAAQIQQRRMAARAPRSRNVSSVRSGRRI